MVSVKHTSATYCGSHRLVSFLSHDEVPSCHTVEPSTHRGIQAFCLLQNGLACSVVDSLRGALKPFPRWSAAVENIKSSINGVQTTAHLQHFLWTTWAFQAFIAAFTASATLLLKSCAVRWTFYFAFSPLDVRHLQSVAKPEWVLPQCTPTSSSSRPLT